MTYRELVDKILDVAKRHYMIAEWGYGELSDIKVKGQNDETGEDEADYPYMFLNPAQHTRDQNSITYRFNLIMMDMAKDDDTNEQILRRQSDAQQYIDDILAELYFEMNDLDVDLVVTLTPFKERFQDSVAGMTATLNVILPVGLNRCIAPFNPMQELYVNAVQEAPQLVGSDLGENRAFGFVTEIVDIDDTWVLNRWNVAVPGDYTIETTYSFQFVKNDPSEAFPVAPRLRYHPIGGAFTYIEANTTTGWPDTPQEGVTYDVKQVWNVTRANGDFQFVYMEDQPGDEADLQVAAGAEIKIYKLG